MGFNVDFYGVNHSSIFVNSNGHLTFGAASNDRAALMSAVTVPMIAPFSADFDLGTLPSGVVAFGQGSVAGRPAFFSFWNGGYFNSHFDKTNALQAVLIDRSDVAAGDFDIELNYDRVQWESGDFEGGSGGLGGTSAVVGTSAGNGVDFLQFVGSRVPGAFLDTNPTTGLRNVGSGEQCGRHVLTMRRGVLGSGSVPPFGQSFVPSSVGTGAPSSLTFTIDNLGNPVPVTGLTFANTLPTGLMIAATPSISNTCGGSLVAVAGGNALGLTGGVVTANSSCTVRVDVVASAAGSYVNTSGSLSSELGDSGTTTATLSVANRADLSLSQTASPDPAISGSNLTYNISVQNAGPSDAVNVQVTDILPVGVTFVSSSGCTEDPSGLAPCSLGTLAVGASAQFSLTVAVGPGTTGNLTNSARATSSTFDAFLGNNTFDLITATQQVVALTMTMVASPDPVIAGTPISYALAVHNAGPSDAVGVEVSDTLPSNTTLIATAGCAEDPNGLAPCSLGTIPVGSTRNYTLDALVDAGATGSLTNTAQIIQPPGTGVSASATTTVTQQADLQISKTGDPMVSAGEAISYQLVVQNLGPSHISGATVSDTFPSSVGGVSWTCLANNGFCNDGSGTLNETVSIDAGGSLTYNINGTIDATAPPGTITNTATVSSSVTDPEVGNNSSAANSQIVRQADLIADLTGPATALAGEPVSYTLVVTNAGPSQVDGATLTQSVAQLEDLTWSCLAVNGSCAASGMGTLSESVNLSPFGQLTLTLQGTVNGSFSGPLNHSLAVNPPSGVNDPDGGNNLDSVITTVTRQADLTVNKSGSGVVNAGEPLTYSIRVQNLGPSDASGVTVSDMFPAAVSSPTWSCSASPGSSCASSGSGDLNDTSANLLAGGELVYSVSAQLASDQATGTFRNTANVTNLFGPDVSDFHDIIVDALSVLNLTFDGPTTGVAGAPISYTLTLANNGPSDLLAGTVGASLPPGLSDLMWTCLASGGSCPASGSGNLNDTVQVDAGGSLQYAFDAEIDSAAAASVTFSVAVTNPSSSDLNDSVTTSLSQTADLAVSMSGDIAVVAGNSIAYDIIVDNLGPSSVDGGTLQDLFPADLSAVTWTCTATLGSCAAAGSGDINDTFTLEPTGRLTYQVIATVNSSAAIGPLVNTASLSSPIDDSVVGNNNASQSTTIGRQGNLSATLTGPVTAVAGEAISYTLVVANAGPSQVDGASLVNTLPAALQDVTWTCIANGGNCASPGSGALNELIDLDAAGFLTYTIQATVAEDSAATTLIHDVALGLPLGINDPDLANNSDSVTTTLAQRADLSISQSGDASATAGQTMSYTLTVSNAGPSSVSTASVTDMFPSGLSSVQWTCVPTDGTCTVSGSGDINDTVGLAPGGSLVYAVSARVDSDAVGPLANTASVSSAVADPNNGNNSDSQNTVISRQADLQITKEGSATAGSGQSLSYTVTVTNNGPSDVTGATVSDTFVASLSNISWSCNAAGAGCGTGSSHINQNLDLVSGASAVFQISADVASDFTGTLSNSASVALPTGIDDPVPGNNTDSHSTVVTRRADLAISKTGDFSVVAGLSIGYDLVVSNLGPSDVTGATVNDVFPATLSQIAWTCSATSGSCPATGSGNLNVAVDLQNGGSATFVVTAVADPSATGTLSNTASVTVPVGTLDDSNANDSSTHPAAVQVRADVAVDLVAPATAVAGSTVRFVLEVSNLGPSDVQGLRVQDSFATELSAISWTCLGFNGTCPASGNGNLDQLVGVQAGGRVTFTIDGMLAATASGNLDNTASVLLPSAVIDPVASNNSDATTTSIESQADLVISKTGSASAIAGGEVTYRLSVTNEGPSEVTGATVSDTFPTDLQAISWTCMADSGNCTNSGSVSLNDTVDLQVGGQLVYVISATVGTGALGTLSNSATVSPSAGVVDPSTGNNSSTHLTTLDQTADLSLTLSGDSSGTPGQTLSYSLEVRNLGPSNVIGAMVNDTFPAGLSNVTWTCLAILGSCPASGSGNLAETIDITSGGRVTFSVTASIDADAVGTLSNGASVNAPAGSNDPQGSNNSASLLTTLGSEADLMLTISDDPDPVAAGDTLTYTLRLTNLGPSAAPNTRLTAQLPAATTFLSGTPGCSETSPGVVVCQLGTSPVAGTSLHDITVRVDSDAVASLSLTAEALSDADDATLNQSNESTVVTRRADLSLTKSDGVSTAIPGDNLTYVITVRNLGPSDIVGARVQDTFPAALDNVTWSCAPSPGAVCTLNGSGPLVDSVDLPSGAVLTYTAQTTLNASASGSISNTARVDPAVGVVDPNLGNNEATDLDTLGSEVDLFLTLTDGQSSAVPGSQIVYTLSVGNRGPSDVQAMVVDNLPPSLLDATWTCSSSGVGSSCAASGSGSISDAAVLRVGGMVTYTLTARVDPAAVGTLNNTASVTAPVGVDDRFPGDNSASDANLLTPHADLTISKTDGASNVRPGDDLTYTLTVSNLGPSDVLAASVTDLFPTALLSVTWTCLPGSGATCAGSPAGGSGSGNIQDLVDLAAGSSVVYNADATLDSNFTGVLTNSATISSPAGVPDDRPSNNSASDVNSAQPEADLRLSNSDGVSSAIPGGSVTYVVTVENAGPSAINGAQISDTFVAPLENCQWTCNPGSGASCAVGTRQGDLQDLVSLNSGASLSYSATCDIAANATGTLSNSAAITLPAGTSDPNLGDNSAQDITALGPQTNLAISLDDGLVEAQPGGVLTYTLSVVNQGPSDAPGVLVRDIFPPALSCVWTCIGAGGATCTPGQVAGNISDIFDLPAGSTAVYTATCDIAADASGTLSNSATVTAPGGVTDVDPNDNASSDLDTVLVPRFDLALHKTDGRSSAQPGEVVTYTVTVSHSGVSDALAVQVNDSLPEDLQNVTWSCLASNGSLCTASGNGDLADTVTLRADGQLVYNLTGTLASDATGVLLNNASLTIPNGTVDSNPSNNADSDSTQIDVALDLTLDKSAPAAAIPGQPLSYTLVVGNLGPADAFGATVQDDLPTVLDGATWTCSASSGSSCTANGSGDINDAVNVLAGGTLTYNLVGTLAEEATGTVDNTALVSAPFGTMDIDLANNVGQTQTLLTPRADLSVTLTDNVDSAIPGRDLTYVLQVDNGGPSRASEVVLTDLFPASLSCTWTCIGSGGAGCPAGPVAGDIEQTLDLPSGGQLIYTVHCDIDPSATGHVINLASLALPVGVEDPDLANNSAQDNTELVPQADLVVSKTDGLTSVRPGDSSTYTIEVSNPNGPSDAKQVLVRDVFAEVLTCTWTCVGTAGGICTPGQVAGDINDDVDLPVGARVVYNAICNIAADADDDLINSATATPPVGLTDPNGSNNSAIDSTEIEALVDLTISLSDGLSNATPGESLTYTLVVDNLGLADAQGALVRDTFPNTVSCTWGCLASPGAVCTAGQVDGDLEDTVDVPAGGQLVYTADCQIDADATGVLNNTASIDPPPSVDDANPGNNTASDLDTQLEPQADLAISKSDGVIGAGPGDTLTYVISVSNLVGPSDAVDATVSDLLPDPLDCTWSCAVSGDATCTAIPAAGDLADTVHLAVGSLATYTGQCTISDDAVGTLSNTATVTPAIGSIDPDLDNNSASDDDTVLTTTVDLTVSLDDGTATAVAGDSITYELEAANPVQLLILGDSEASPVVYVLDVGSALMATHRMDLAEMDSLGDLPFSSHVRHPLTGNLYELASASGGSTRLIIEASNLESNDPSNHQTASLPLTFDDPNVQPRGIVFMPTVDVLGASVQDVFPSSLQCSWTCTGSGGGICSPGPIDGSINDLVDLPAGSAVTYTADCLLAADATGVLTNRGSVTPPPGIEDSEPSNNSATATVDIVQQADLVLSKSDGTDIAHPGGSVTYTIVASNPLGPSDVLGAQVVDFFATSLSCLWTCEANGGATCTPGQLPGDIQDTVDLPVGGSATYLAVCSIDGSAVGHLSNTADLLPPVGVVELDPSDNHASDLDTALVPLADLHLTMSDGVVEAVPGMSLTYTLGVSNEGPSDVTTATVEDVFPQGLSCLWSCAASGGAFCTPGQVAGDLLDSIALPVGSDVTYQAICNIDSNLTGSLSNSARVTLPSPGVDPDLDNNVAHDDDTVLRPSADLQLSKDNGVDTVHPGGTVSYELVLDNTLGPSAMIGAQIVDVLPASLVSCAWSCATTGGATCSAELADGDLSDTVDLPLGSRTVYTGLCAIADDAVGSLANTASVSPAVGSSDPNANNNSASDVDTLIALVDLVLTLDDGQDDAVAGATSTYSIEVSNLGPSSVVGATVSVTLPETLTCSWTCQADLGSQCTAHPQNGDLNDTVDLGVGSSLLYAGDCTIDPEAVGSLSVSGSVTPPSGTQEADIGNNSDSDSTLLRSVADLAITKSDGQTAALPGDEVVYAIQVRNHGPSHGAELTVRDLFPQTLTCTWTCSASAGAQCAEGTQNGDLLDEVELAPDASLLYSATCLIDGNATGAVENTASVETINDLDPDLSNNSATDIDLLGDEADLSIELLDEPDPVASGNLLLYRATIHNQGPLSDGAVVVTVLLPDLVDFVTAVLGDPNQLFSDGFESGDISAWNGSTSSSLGDGLDPCTLQGSTLTCSVGSLAAGGTEELVVAVDVTAIDGSTLVATATVSGQGNDPDSSNNSASVISTVGAEEGADLGSSMIRQFPGAPRASLRSTRGGPGFMQGPLQGPRQRGDLVKSLAFFRSPLPSGERVRVRGLR